MMHMGSKEKWLVREMLTMDCAKAASIMGVELAVTVRYVEYVAEEKAELIQEVQAAELGISSLTATALAIEKPSPILKE